MTHKNAYTCLHLKLQPAERCTKGLNWDIAETVVGIAQKILRKNNSNGTSLSYFLKAPGIAQTVEASNEYAGTRSMTKWGLVIATEKTKLMLLAKKEILIKIQMTHPIVEAMRLQNSNASEFSCT